MVSMIVNCEHSALYFATQGHSILNLRNTLPVWWRYELCEDTEALQCTLYGVKTKHNITKYFVSKSSFVCNMVKYVVEIIVVWFQLFTWRLLVSVEKLWARLMILCYVWCLVISKIWSWLVFKINWKVQAIMCAFCKINFQNPISL